MQINLNYKNSITLFLFLFLATNFDTSIYYVIYVLVVVAFILFIIKVKRIPFGRMEDYIALMFLFVWIYGILIGAKKGNTREFIVANFAGMSCYLIYFVLLIGKFQLEYLSKLLLRCGIVIGSISIFSLILFVMNIHLPPLLEMILGTKLGMASTGQIRVYFTTLCTVYPLLGISLYRIMQVGSVQSCSYISSIRYAYLLFLFSVFALFFVPSSKGFLLGGLAILVVIPFFFNLNSLLVGKINKKIFILIILCILLYIALISFDYISIIEQLFDEEDESNAARYEQLYFLLDDITLWGQGLGALVPGSVRSQEAPYGFELTFVNLVHKFGIFSIILFIGWLYMIISCLKFIKHRKCTPEAVLAFSSMGYLFPSIGNPLLMHPSLVVLNCITLYYIRIIRIKG